MALNGYQLFARHDDPDAVADAIRAYVGEHGSGAVLWPDKDEPDPALARRTQRTFTLAPPTDGWITVWEDGLWADRRLAQRLSRALGTEVIWLQLTDSTGIWAYARYQDGEPAGGAVSESDDPYPAAQRFANEHGLPYAFDAPSTSSQDEDDDAWLDRLEAGEFDDDIASPLDGGDDDADEDDEVEWDEDEEELETGPRLDAVRDALRELTVRVT